MIFLVYGKDREFGSKKEQFQIQRIREKQEEPVTLYMVSSIIVK